MPGLGPPAVVAPPPATAPLHSLVASALPVNEGSTRWEMGFEFCPEGCVSVHAWDPRCSGGFAGVGDKSAPDVIPDVVPTIPFILETAVECCTYGFQAQDYEGRARRQLEAGTPKGLEAEFWSGAKIAENLHLASAAAEVIAGPLQPAHALAALNQALADCALGGRGMIHATPYLATLWTANNLLVEDGPRLVGRVMKNIVVAGTGYPGTSPAGAAASAGTTWAYATGMVQVRLGDIVIVPDTVAEALDRKQNTINYRAERTAAASWDGCCHFAVQVTV